VVQFGFPLFSLGVSGEVDVREGDKNSTFVGISNLFMKCHGEPENHKLLYDHGTITLSI